jgi:hypothetical protein
MNIRNYLKSLLALKCITITQLAKMMSEKTGETYTLKSLSGKLARESLTFKEILIIAELLGYDIKFIERK